MSLLTKFPVLASIVPRRVSAVTYGVVAGLLAVGVQVFFGVKPPSSLRHLRCLPHARCGRMAF